MATTRDPNDRLPNPDEIDVGAEVEADQANLPPSPHHPLHRPYDGPELLDDDGEPWSNL
jgi:hypothetical protein